MEAMTAWASAEADSKAPLLARLDRQQSLFEDHGDAMPKNRPHPHAGAVTRGQEADRSADMNAHHRGAAIGAGRHGLETHTPARMMVRPAISFSSFQAWTRRGAT